MVLASVLGRRVLLVGGYYLIVMFLRMGGGEGIRGASPCFGGRHTHSM